MLLIKFMYADRYEFFRNNGKTFESNVIIDKTNLGGSKLIFYNKKKRKRKVEYQGSWEGRQPKRLAAQLRAQPGIS